MNLEDFESGLSSLMRGLNINNSDRNSLENRSFSHSMIPFRHCSLASADAVEDFIRTYRVAVKLSLFQKAPHKWGPEERLGAGTQISELALTLLSSEQNVDIVKAGLLYASVDELTNDVPGVLRRTFGTVASSSSEPLITDELMETIELLDKSLKDPSILLDHPTSLAALHCSVVTMRLAQELPVDEDVHLLAQYYQRAGVSDCLRVQFLLEAPDIPLDHFVADVDISVSNDVIRMRNALRFAGFLFSGVDRSWGPDERLPLVWHAAEVGFLPILSGVEPDVVVAAICHDMLECYVDFVEPSFIEEKLSFFFGPRVAELVKRVTEPPKVKDAEGHESVENWTHRKEAVLRNLLSGDEELATLSCATKISTLAAGNKMLAAGKSFSDWSSGPIEDNLTMFAKYGEAYTFSGISPVLLELYHREISRMVRLLTASGQL